MFKILSVICVLIGLLIGVYLIIISGIYTDKKGVPHGSKTGYIYGGFMHELQFTKCFCVFDAEKSVFVWA